MSNIEL